MDLLTLAERVERYTPSGNHDVDRDNERDLNEAIGLAVGVGHRIKVGDPALGNDRWVPTPLKPYVTSLDAAMTLVPEGQDVMLAVLRGSAYAGCGRSRNDGDVEAASLPLALCASALRARAQATSQ